MQAYAFHRGREPYDAAKYVDLLIRAVEPILTPLGITRQQIEEMVNAKAGEREQRATSSAAPVINGSALDYADAVAKQRKNKKK